MQLHLPIPAEWRQHETAGRRVIMPHSSNAVALIIDPLEPLPPLREPAWLLARVHRDIPAGATLVVRKTVSATTRAGWPATLLDIHIVEEGAAPPAPEGADMPLAPTSRLIERRITACYQFLEYCVLAEIRARDLNLLHELEDQLRALFTQGRPDWSNSDTSLHRLLVGVER